MQCNRLKSATLIEWSVIIRRTQRIGNRSGYSTMHHIKCPNSNQNRELKTKEQHKIVTTVTGPQLERWEFDYRYFIKTINKLKNGLVYIGMQ